MLSKTNNNCLINIVAYDESGREVGKDLSEDYFVIKKIIVTYCLRGDFTPSALSTCCRHCFHMSLRV
jgi:hypothetical protein